MAHPLEQFFGASMIGVTVKQPKYIQNSNIFTNFHLFGKIKKMSKWSLNQLKGQSSRKIRENSITVVPQLSLECLLSNKIGVLIPVLVT